MNSDRWPKNDRRLRSIGNYLVCLISTALKLFHPRSQMLAPRGPLTIIRHLL